MASSPTRPTAQPSTSSTSTTLTTSGASTTTVTAATDNTISCIECLSAHAPQSRKTKTDLSAGVIAGIVIGIVFLVGCLATAGFKFSRRPPLFRNCGRKGFETARNFDNAVYSPSHDKVQLAINPVSPSDMTQPTTTTTTTSPASQMTSPSDHAVYYL
ncbi:uncharacterized protein LOC112571942 [Pomacea canaliculata]|uniref:uncharacterized protein LOC112571942 n=1 Tax=Pomacea canaliculata TaxID=400727 RepID=UPI000D734B8E|nr:uncharacterized protein LOC112571942 [Pomacea canaliculata]